jgi:hypothetical protein
MSDGDQLAAGYFKLEEKDSIQIQNSYFKKWPFTRIDSKDFYTQKFSGSSV